MQTYIIKLEEEIKLRNYSSRTREAYVQCVSYFLKYWVKEEEQLKTIDRDLIKKMILHLQSKGIEKLPLSAQSRKLPTILSIEEIQKLIASYTNPKHRLMIQLSYGCGLRVSEVVNIQVHDIDLDRQVIMIRQSKGAKDRQVLLPNSLLGSLTITIA